MFLDPSKMKFNAAPISDDGWMVWQSIVDKSLPTYIDFSLCMFVAEPTIELLPELAVEPPLFGPAAALAFIIAVII